MKNKKKVVLIIVVFSLVATILYFSVNFVGPYGCIPIDDLDRGDTYLEVVYKKGFPDGITRDAVNGKIYLIYENQTVLGNNMIVEYGFWKNCLTDFYYYTDYENYEPDEFLENTKEYILGNMDCEYRVDELWSDENHCRIMVGNDSLEKIAFYDDCGRGCISINFYFI